MNATRRLCLLANALLLGAGLGACDPPLQGAGDRCASDVDCHQALRCSNRDQPDELGVCVHPEALPDAAVPTQDASA